jgi:nucleoside-diphosphate-sugar epimerase
MTNTQKSILITGGAGYLGSILCQHLLRKGHRVHVLDNLSFAQHPLFHLCADPNFQFTFGDCRDEATLKPLVEKADVLIPLAAMVGAPLCQRDPISARTINLEAVQLLNRLRSPRQLVIYPNTNSGYGISSGQSFCTEETPLAPISLYGQTKCQAEIELLGSPNAITLRLATVFGASPRMRIDLLVNHFVYAAVTDGYLVLFEKDFKRNFVHIRDVADCFCFCIEQAEKMIGRPYNLGLDEANLSKQQLAEKIKEHVPNFYLHYASIGSDPDKRNYIVSNQRLAEAGFTARRSLDEGIRELLTAYHMLGRGQFKNV